MKAFTLDKPRGFALSAASDFYAGFIPGSGMAAAAVDNLTLAFRLDHTFEAVAVALRESGDSLVAEYCGTDDAGAVARQVARMLGLDADGDAWLALGRRDPVVGALQAEFAGFFTAAKASPYDAAAWGVLSPRMNMRSAARLKMAIAQAHGDEVRLQGRSHHVFPSPRQVLGIGTFPGLPTEKLERLHGIANAALLGKLDADRLRAMAPDDALSELQTLRGVGPWTASHILFRGAALHDALPTAEPRVLHGLAHAYGIPSPSMETFERLSEGWRPCRMWVCILLARHLREAGGWNDRRLAGERGAMGRKAAPRASTGTGRSRPEG
jgi:DNA-3-methyladenine glycosylase II